MVTYEKLVIVQCSDRVDPSKTLLCDVVMRRSVAFGYACLDYVMAAYYHGSITFVPLLLITLSEIVIFVISFLDLAKLVLVQCSDRVDPPKTLLCDVVMRRSVAFGYACLDYLMAAYYHAEIVQNLARQPIRFAAMLGVTAAAAKIPARDPTGTISSMALPVPAPPSPQKWVAFHSTNVFSTIGNGGVEAKGPRLKAKSKILKLATQPIRKKVASVRWTVASNNTITQGLSNAPEEHAHCADAGVNVMPLLPRQQPGAFRFLFPALELYSTLKKERKKVEEIFLWAMVCGLRRKVYDLSSKVEVLARAAKTQVEMFKCGDHIMGFQGHPEYTHDILLHLIDRLLQKILHGSRYYVLRMSMRVGVVRRGSGSTPPLMLPRSGMKPNIIE
nr:gamma-glutamyl peptidase 5-like [Tanacetum cinerariifolium]